MNDYEKDLEINSNNLQSEWEKQAPLFMFYAKESAKLERDKDLAKEATEVVKAELDAQIREDFAEGIASKSFGIKAPKLTEAIVSNTITKHSKYKEAFNKYMDAKYSHAILSSAVKAFEHKKKALENLVMLNLSGLYAEPKERQPQQMLKTRGRSRRNNIPEEN
jgi:hypothetical protein